MRLIPNGEMVRLADLEPGTLFSFGGDCVALKSEYMTEAGRIEAYIVGSGEFFHGGAITAEEQRNLMVQPLEIVEVVHARFDDGACTNCGWFGDCEDTPHYNFCPGCGAKMDAKE